MAVKVEFTLFCKPMSVNKSKMPINLTQNSAAFTKGRMRFVSTPEFRNQQNIYHSQLIFHKEKLRALLESERASTKGIVMEFTFHITNLYTKKGTINRKAGDVDNFLKGLIDAIFQIVQSDDAFVVKLIVEKVQSTQEKIEVKLSENLR